jgi:hypothetical protein
MNIFSSLRKWVLGNAGASSMIGDSIRMRCQRCGEVLTVRINLMNDLSVEYDENGKVRGYFCRKVAMGKGMCFQRVVIESRYDAGRHLRERKVQAGTLMDGSED